MSKISIITINYNNLAGLKRTVESVVNQTWKEFEYIIIDGGSSDGSAEYLESKSHHFDYWVSEKDNGIYNAMNRGIKVATGEYLLFLNSGDHLYDKHVLKNQNHHLMNEDLIYFDLEVVGEKKKFIKEYPTVLSFAYFLKDSLPHPATFIKKTEIVKYGYYDENLKIIADWKFFIDSVCKSNLNYKRVDSILSTFYLDGMSSNPENRNNIVHERQTVLKGEYCAFIKDIDDILVHRDIIKNFRDSRIIKLLIKFGFLNNF